MIELREYQYMCQWDMNSNDYIYDFFPLSRLLCIRSALALFSITIPTAIIAPHLTPLIVPLLHTNSEYLPVIHISALFTAELSRCFYP